MSFFNVSFDCKGSSGSCNEVKDWLTDVNQLSIVSKIDSNMTTYRDRCSVPTQFIWDLLELKLQMSTWVSWPNKLRGSGHVRWSSEVATKSESGVGWHDFLVPPFLWWKRWRAIASYKSESPELGILSIYHSSYKRILSRYAMARVFPWQWYWRYLKVWPSMARLK